MRMSARLKVPTLDNPRGDLGYINAAIRDALVEELGWSQDALEGLVVTVGLRAHNLGFYYAIFSGSGAPAFSTTTPPKILPSERKSY